MEAIVLVGGFGTRLRHIIPDVPKPMAPVCGRPFLRYILDDLTKKGVDVIILAVGYLQQNIINYFGNQYRGARIIYSSEDTPLFTGGAIKKALSHCKEDTVFVVNGDTYFDVDLEEMYKYQKKVNSSLIIAVKEMQNFTRYGTVNIIDHQILSFEEKKPCDSGFINGGVYLLKNNLVDKVLEDKFSFETDLLPKIVNQISIYAYNSDGYFIDIGIPEDYEKAQVDFSNQGEVKNKAAFFDRDGTINVDIHYLYRTEDLKFIDGMPEFIKKHNDQGYKVIVVTNQAGIARGYYTEDDMRVLHRYMNEQLAQIGAHIDAFYFCPHHPDFSGPCHCRKPETGMLEAAIWDFDIDVTQSVIYGDKPWDIESGKKCGIKGYLIGECNLSEN